MLERLQLQGLQALVLVQERGLQGPWAGTALHVQAAMHLLTKPCVDL